jgi:hypothetical protein
MIADAIAVEEQVTAEAVDTAAQCWVCNTKCRTHLVHSAVRHPLRVAEEFHFWGIEALSNALPYLPQAAVAWQLDYGGVSVAHHRHL